MTELIITQNSKKSTLRKSPVTFGDLLNYARHMKNELGISFLIRKAALAGMLRANYILVERLGQNEGLPEESQERSFR